MIDPAVRLHFHVRVPELPSRIERLRTTRMNADTKERGLWLMMMTIDHDAVHAVIPSPVLL